MTTGNVTTNRRIPWTLPGYGEFGVGSGIFNVADGDYWNKTWSGADRAYKGDVTPHNYVMSYTHLASSGTGYTIPPNGAFHVCSLPCAMYGFLQFGGEGIDMNNNDVLKLISRLRAKIEGSDFNLSITVGEGRETLLMLGSTFRRLLTAFRSAKRLDVVSLARALGKLPLSKKQLRAVFRKTGDKASNLWLEYIFGWLPLLGDIEDGLKKLEHLYAKPNVQRFMARLHKHSEDQYPDNGTFSVSSPMVTDCHCQLIAYVTHVNSATLQGLTNPMVVVWELTPFSFLADWLIPVGDYLDALNSASGITAKFVLTKKWNRELKWATPVPTHGTKILTPGYIYYRRLEVARNTAPVLSAFIGLPQVKSVASFASGKRVLTSLALLRQQLAKVR